MGRGNMKTWRHGHGLEVETGNRKVLPFFFLVREVEMCVCPAMGFFPLQKNTKQKQGSEVRTRYGNPCQRPR